MTPYTDDEIIAKAKDILWNRFTAKGRPMSNPQDVKDYLVMRYSVVGHEIFSVLYLDNQHRVIQFEDLFRGTIDGASVYPREVVKQALKYNAAAVVFAHNHPSGTSEPSQADRRLTDRLVDACKLVDIRVLDHLVVGATDAVSFAERGWM